MKKISRGHTILLLIVAIGLFAIGSLPGCSDTDEKMACYTRAKNCYDKQDYLCAKTALEQAIQIDPEFGGAFANLGEVYLKLGKISDAFTSL